MAVIIGAFERQLDERVLLAFFIRGIVYMAAAIGTQTQAGCRLDDRDVQNPCPP